MFTRKFDGLVDESAELPQAWPGLVAAMIASVLVTGALFWLRGSVPNLRVGHDNIDVIAGFSVAVLFICMMITGAVWFVMWFGMVRRTGRPVADKYFATLLATALITAGAVTWIKLDATAGQRQVAQMELQWRLTQERDIQSFVNEINAMRLSDVVDPALIAKGHDLDEATDRLARARASVAKYRRWRTERIAAYRVKIAAVKADAATRARLLSAFERQRRQTEVDVQDYFDAEENALLETEALAKFLHRNRGGWHMEGEVIMFHSRGQFETWRRGIANYRENFADQSHLRWNIDANTLFARDVALFPDPAPSASHRFVLF